MKKTPQPPRIQETLMDAIRKGIRVVQSPAALALAVLFAMTRLAGAQPTVGYINVAGIMLCTNTELTCTVTSSSSTITNVSLSYTTTLLGGANATSVTTNLNSHATGLKTATATVTYPLITNVIYTQMSITALDDTGASGTTNGLVSGAPEVFDTLQPALVIEAEDYNYTNGGYMNTPPDGGLALYQGLVGIQNVDFYWITSTGPANYYRPADDAGGLGPQCETTGNNFGLQPQKFWTSYANGDTTDVPVEIGYNSAANWLDYTRDFGPASTNSAPAGTYNVYVFLSDDDTADPSVTLSEVTSGATTSNQATSATLGVFNLTDANWNNYYYVPMTDRFGNPASVTLTGHETLRGTVVGEANIDFYMLVPVTAVLSPILENSYPDGLHPFEATNSFTFTVGAANGAGIPESGVSLIVDGQNVTSGLTLTGATNSWTGSFPITSNTIYTATISVSNSAGLISSFALNFDTFDVNSFQWEANDYDYSTNNGTAWISGLFIDNPVPTCDINATATGHEATNSYFGYPGGVLPDLENASNGAAAQSGIDFFDQGPQPIASGTDDYRRDGDGSQVTGDYLRPKFIAAQKQFNDPNIGPYQIGYTTSGDWQNYTRHYPSGKFTLYARIAGNSAWSGSQMALVTSGVGTASQTDTVLGTFADPNAAGWESFHWIPCMNSAGAPASIELGGLQTLKFICGGGVNEAYFMLVPFEAPTVPVLVSHFPDGSQPFQATNSFSFEVTAASGAPIDSSGIGLTLNGVSVTGELTLSSSTTNWIGSVPLVANTYYAAVLSVTNTSGFVSSFYESFDTFDVNNYQWEANDYDFNSGLYIDNPEPSCDINGPGLGELETNSYFAYPANISGAAAVSGIDFYDQAPQTVGGANDYYRFDGQGSAPTGDYLRPKFVAARTALGDVNIGPVQEGYTTAGDWGNYTRHYPAGNFNIYGRIAGGAGPWKGTEVAMVTSGQGTATQTYNVLGAFADPNAAGWEVFHWIPLLATNTGALAVVPLGGLATLRVICGGGVNEAYYMLVPAPTQLSPRLGASLLDGQLNISIPTLTGHNYQVYYSASLSPAKWGAVGNVITGDGSTHTVGEATTGQQGYYKVEVQ